MRAYPMGPGLRTVASDVAVWSLLVPPGRGAAAGQAPPASADLVPVVSNALYVDVSPPARSLSAALAPESEKEPKLRRIIRANPLPPRAPEAGADAPFGITDDVQREAPAASPLPAPALVFDGISVASQSIAVYPPDTVGEVGPNHYVQMVNLRWQVFSKTTGAPLTGVLSLRSLWAAAGRTDLCAQGDRGDPVVLYDSFADRWILSQFAFGSTGAPPYVECIAVSTSPDPTGSYYLYSFLVPEEAPGVSQFPDYPKLGVWPDAYYMAVNQFRNFGYFDGTGAYAYEREAMLRGDLGARQVYFDLNYSKFREGIAGALPSDADGLRPPPAGMPNVFAERPTFTPRPEATLAGPLAVTPFHPRAPGRADIEQPGTDAALDSLSDRLMHRLQYCFGTHETLVVNHTVNVGTCGATVDKVCHRAGAPDPAFTLRSSHTPIRR